MRPLVRTLLRVAALAGLAALCSCSGGGVDDPEDLVDSTFIVRLAAGTSLGGASFDLMHGDTFTVLGVSNPAPGVAVSCESNIETSRLRDACVFASSVSSSQVEWLVTVRARSGVTAVDGITSLTCAGSDLGGNPLVLNCTAL
jgi:hypothetical protein